MADKYGGQWAGCYTLTVDGVNTHDTTENSVKVPVNSRLVGVVARLTTDSNAAQAITVKANSVAVSELALTIANAPGVGTSYYAAVDADAAANVDAGQSVGEVSDGGGSAGVADFMFILQPR